MKNCFLILIFLPFAFNCANKNKLPEEILPREKMREVMWDMVLAGEYLNGFLLSKDSTLDKIAETQKWYNKIYALHKITKKDFDRSYAYYQQHPVLMKELLDSLSKKQVQVKPNYGQHTPVPLDSLNNKSLRHPSETRQRLIDSLQKRKKIVKKVDNIQ